MTGSGWVSHTPNSSKESDPTGDLRPQATERKSIWAAQQAEEFLEGSSHLRNLVKGNIVESLSQELLAGRIQDLIAGAMGHYLGSLACELGYSPVTSSHPVAQARMRLRGRQPAGAALQFLSCGFLSYSLK